MKKILLAIIAVFCAVSTWAKAPDGWLTDYDQALKEAQKSHKYVFVLFTGSDWCPYCVRLRKDVLETERFKKFAAEKLITVYCDDPRNDPPSRRQLAKQQQWKKELKAGRGVPSVVVVNSKGKVVTRISGYAPVNVYMSKLEKELK